ncbi:MAG TPA: hypothetical protein VFK16_10390 [Gemmatimonadaceae bacterium]|jgi:hypothetical protein|nr:hypothetical protein [Gemmatimonadaceae bacterium]
MLKPLARPLVAAAIFVAVAACGSDHGATTSPPDYVSLAGEYTAVSYDGGPIDGDLQMTDSTYQYEFHSAPSEFASDSGSYTATRAGFITVSRCMGLTGVYSLSEGVLTWYLLCGDPGVEVYTYVWKRK